MLNEHHVTEKLAMSVISHICNPFTYHRNDNVLMSNENIHMNLTVAATTRAAVIENQSATVSNLDFSRVINCSLFVLCSLLGRCSG